MRTKRSLKLLHPASLLALLTLLTFACERRDLHVLLDERVKVKVVVNWQVNYVTLYGDEPNGMSVMVWQDGIGQPTVKASNSNSVDLALTTGTYYMMVFNELREDYNPRLKFNDIDNYDMLTVRANSYHMGYGWDEGVTYMYSPDDPRMCVAIDTLEITPEMLVKDTTILIPYDEFINNDSARHRESTLVYKLDEVTWPMTVDLFIKARVKHRQSIKDIDGSISGMADGFLVSRINRTSTPGALRFYPEMFENYKLGEEEDSLGLITVKIPSFGLPYGKELLSQRDSADNVLTFHLTLVNDSVQHVSFKVGKEIRYITPEGKEAEVRYRQDLRNLLLELDLSDTIVAPYIPPKAAFDARVDEWEDGGTIDISL